jgi:prevent-host-death family protein
MITEVSAVTFRPNLGEMPNKVQHRSDSVVISKDGKPVAVLIDAALFARIRRQQERFGALAARLAADFAGVPQEEGLARIDRVAGEVRAECKQGRR